MKEFTFFVLHEYVEVLEDTIVKTNDKFGKGAIGLLLREDKKNEEGLPCEISYHKQEHLTFLLESFSTACEDQ